MQDSLVERLFAELSVLSEKDGFQHVLDLLAKRDYLLEFTCQFDLDENIDNPPVPLGFVYRRKVHRTRLDVARAGAPTRIDMGSSREQTAVWFAGLGESLLDLYSKGLLKQISAVLLEFMKSTSWFVEDDRQRYCRSRTSRLVIECKQFELLAIHHSLSDSGELDDKLDSALTDPSYFLRNVPRMTRLRDQPWFGMLTPDSRACIEMGTRLLDALYVESVEGHLPDYGALLFPFVKAAEIEISRHFKLYSDPLISNSLVLAGQLAPGSFGDWLKHRKKYKDPSSVLQVAENVLRSGDGFRPSMHSLYHFLSYYGARKSPELIDDLDSYLPFGKVRMLRRWGDDFRWILGLHYRRARWVNGGVVEGSFEFELWYEELCRLLKLLSELNAEDETT